MANLILKYGFVFLILYTGYDIYEKWTLHVENFEQLQSSISPIERKIEEKKKEIKLLESYFKDIEAAKEKIGEVRLGVENLKKQFPEEVNDTENLEMISSLSKDINIKAELEKSGSEVRGFYILQKYKYKGVGTFLQFLVFFEKLASLDRIFNVYQLEFTNVKDKAQRGRFQVIQLEGIVTTYKANKNYVEEAPPPPPVEEKPKKKKKKDKISSQTEDG